MLPPSTQPRSRLRRRHERFNIEVPIRGAVELADELQGALFIGGDAIGAGLEMLIVGDKSVPPVIEIFIEREMNRSCDSKSFSAKAHSLDKHMQNEKELLGVCVGGFVGMVLLGCGKQALGVRAAKTTIERV